MGRTIPSYDVGERICLCLYRSSEQVDPCTMGTTSAPSCLAFVGLLTSCVAAPWTSVTERTNVWVTMAGATGWGAICLSVSSSNKPFRTCLVNLPDQIAVGRQLCVKQQQPRVLSAKLQKMELLGSVKMDFCLFSLTIQELMLLEG